MSNSQQIPHARGGRNALVRCTCQDICLVDDPKGCLIESWRRDKHMASSARTQASVRPLKKAEREGRSVSSLVVNAASSRSAPVRATQQPERPAQSRLPLIELTEDVEMHDEHAAVQPETRPASTGPMDLYEEPVEAEAERGNSPLQADLTFGMYAGDPDTDEEDNRQPVVDPVHDDRAQAALPDEPAAAPASTSQAYAAMARASADTANIAAVDTLNDDSPHVAHPVEFVRVIMVLVAYLNVRWHLPHSAAAVLLFALRSIFVSTGLLTADDPMPVTLNTTYKRLNIRDEFHILVSCSKCSALYPPASDPAVPKKCTACGNSLWREHAGDAPSDSENEVPILDTVINAIQRFGRARRSTPQQVAPCRLLSDMLVELFREHPELFEQVEAWKDQTRTDGVLNSIQDGEVWKTIRSKDGKVFFDVNLKGEIRLGVTVALDWFKVTTSPFAPSHSSGVYSFCIANLADHLRYDPRYLLVSSLTPGPTEPDADQLQHFSAFIVDDLINLYENGISIPRPDSQGSNSNPVRVRVALLGIVCDHPALCKMGGFADHGSKNAPCTKCTVSHADMHNEDNLSGESPDALRTADDHRKYAQAYRDGSNSKRNKILEEHGVRWSEFTRLSYFDPIRMTIVDPMHNILLGLVKCQWYTCWIKPKVLRPGTKTKKHELDILHEFLADLETPSWSGRMPSQLGIPAGGSLGADEYRTLITIPCPMVLPFVWAQRDQDDDDDVEGEDPNGDETRLTLLLACAIKLYGTGVMKPNHHWCMHIFDQLRDYGPVPNFWSFTVERLNKIMKGFNLNHWGGGRLEVTLMRYKERDAQVRELRDHGDETSSAIATRMLSGQESERIRDEFMVSADEEDDRMVSQSLVPGAVYSKEALKDPNTLRMLYEHYNSERKRVYRVSDRNRPRHGAILSDRISLLTHTVLDGRRIVPLVRSRRQLPCSDAIVKALVNGKSHVGVVRQLFQHTQAGIRESGHTIFAEMLWMVPEPDKPLGDPWADFPELEIEFWQYDQYQDPKSPTALPTVIQASQIICQAARGVCRAVKPNLWITSALEKHAVLMGYTTQPSAPS
ncbi:hypothetical protein PENSPDRAFT_758090 [Peniophora sp. CONT]|nr:hypothetical protein PENSPDRAFT_758090 [Peniophora sp. CONT]